MTRVRDTPHVRRHRLFDRTRQRYRCRVCLRTFRDGNLERHRDREIAKLGVDELVRRIELFLVRRGRRRWRRRTQYYHEKSLAMDGRELDDRRIDPTGASSTPNPGTRRTVK